MRPATSRQSVATRRRGGAHAGEWPIPETWGAPPEGRAVRLSVLLEAGLYATDFVPSSKGAEVGLA
jgi:hypothetical protein